MSRRMGSFAWVVYLYWCCPSNFGSVLECICSGDGELEYPVLIARYMLCSEGIVASSNKSGEHERAAGGSGESSTKILSFPYKYHLC